MLPRLKTGAIVGLLFLALAPAARAWTWPASGAVLRPFSLGDDPYLGGQHRGIDIGGKEGESVLAPRAGAVSFAGRLPASGLTVTIRTDDGYSVTLVHLGSVVVKRNAVLQEGDPIGALAASRNTEWPVPYVHPGAPAPSDPTGSLAPLASPPPRPPLGTAPADTGAAPAAGPPPAAAMSVPPEPQQPA